MPCVPSAEPQRRDGSRCRPRGAGRPAAWPWVRTPCPPSRCRPAPAPALARPACAPNRPLPVPDIRRRPPAAGCPAAARRAAGSRRPGRAPRTPVRLPRRPCRARWRPWQARNAHTPRRGPTPCAACAPQYRWRPLGHPPPPLRATFRKRCPRATRCARRWSNRSAGPWTAAAVRRVHAFRRQRAPRRLPPPPRAGPTHTPRPHVPHR